MMKNINPNLNPKEVKYPVEIHYVHGEENEEGYYIAFLPDFGLYACGAAGDTPEEALISLESLRTSVVEKFIQDGDPLPKPSPNPTEIIELQQMPLRVPKYLHDKLKRLCKKNSQSLNSYVVSVLTEHLSLTTFEEKLDAMLDKKWHAFFDQSLKLQEQELKHFMISTPSHLKIGECGKDLSANQLPAWRRYQGANYN